MNDAIPLHEQGRVPHLTNADRLRIARNLQTPAHIARTNIGQHTRDCRDPQVRARIARASENEPSR